MTGLPSRYWQDLGTADFGALDAARAVAIQPLAAVEQHGPHLPVSVDSDINKGILDAALALLPVDAPVLVLPPQSVGKSDEHNRFPGTLSVPAETLIRHWNAIGDSVARAGVRRIVFFNSHGGNPPVMDIVARDLRARHAMLAVTANWWNLVDLETWFDPAEIEHGVHGGEIETSLMLHLRPDLVDMDKAADFVSSGRALAETYTRLSATSSPSFAWETQDLHPSGAVGNAAAADADRGQQVVGAAATGLAELLIETARFDLDRLANRVPKD
jgi:creatinine amidohydrolase